MASDIDDAGRMEENEWAFCSLWSKETRIRCARALVNPRLKGDYFFNRATVENCDVPYEQVARVFWDAGIDCHLYFRSQPPQDLSVADTMYVLRSAGKVESGRGKVTVCKPSDITTWIDVFCRSFSVPEWKDEVSRVMTASAKKLDLLLAYNNDDDDDMPAGCAALFTKNNVTGIYCLGTVPAQRSKGVARSILNFAKALSEKRGLLLFLQTLGSENLLGLYKSAGFEIAYTKAICAVPKKT